MSGSSHHGVSSSTTMKQLSQRKELRLLKRQIYHYEIILSKLRRKYMTLLPWEEVARGLQDETLQQVRNNRTLKNDIEKQRNLYAILYSWIQSMDPLQEIQSTHETWRNFHLFNGDENSRRHAQKWIISQAYHNTERLLTPLGYPQALIDYHDINIILDDVLYRIQVAGQCVLSYSLDILSSSYWIAINTFSKYRDSPFLPSLPSMDNILYHFEDEDNAPNLNIRKNCLHGLIRDEKRTIIIFRTILQDDAFPIVDSHTWTIDMKEWIVLDSIESNKTRVRSYYTIDHPTTSNGYVTLERMANVFQVHCDRNLRENLRKRMIVSHQLQRELFMKHLKRILNQFHS